MGKACAAPRELAVARTALLQEAGTSRDDACGDAVGNRHGNTLPAPELCDRAREARDARFDGLFFTGVTSTGIYCRPVCPAPVPKRRNIRYFASAAAAAAAGFRPCLRCRPELAPGAMAHRLGEALLDRALAMIADGALQEGSVDVLAARLGVSARQLRRLFVDTMGVAPLALHTTRRLLLAKQLLSETDLPATQIALASGFHSVRRFNAAFQEGCGLAPTQIRRARRQPVGNGLTLRLCYRPPFDFAALLGFLGKRAMPGLERVDADSYQRLAGTPEAPVRLRITADPQQPELHLQIDGADPRAIPDLVRRVRRLFDLDADLAPVHRVFASDPLLARGIAQRPGLRVPGGWDGFEIAVRAILGQQISVTGATTLAARLLRSYGTPCATSSDGFDRFFPPPEALRMAPLEGIGLPRARAASLRALAAAVADGVVDFSAGQRLDEFVARLCALPGIGPWTAHYVAMRALGHPDAFPSGDLILRQSLGGDTTLKERDCEARSQAWRPWRAYAVVHLWQLSNDLAKERT
ncbi:MAG: AlkA N-terminal domain-containing protein [Xanthomonadaceae bacterium]|nr:AlkA N-terminal domain-containing protein [Xanthomonadaceae bacterium]